MDGIESPVSEVVASAASWAHGCDECRYGILIEPVGLERWAKSSLYIRRAYGWKLDAIVFCECRAGHMQRQYARRMWDLHGDERRLGRATQAIDQPPTIQAVHREDAARTLPKEYA